MAPPKAPPLGPPENDTDEFVNVALANAQREYGRARVYTAAEHEKYEYGFLVPPRALPLRFLIASNIWPLSRVTQSCGRTRTCKSAFMMQLEAWCLTSNGVVNHYDTENKTSSSLLRSIIPDKFMTGELSRRFSLRRTETINEWQQMMIKDFELLEELYKQKGRKAFPIFWGVDPLMGSDTDDMADAIKEAGEAPGRRFSDAPRMIWQFLRDLTSRQIQIPLTVHFSHHEREKVGTQHGIDKAGGTGVEFLATIDLQFRLGMLAASEENYAGGKASEFTEIDRKTKMRIEGKHINIRCRKNSNGPDVDKRIYVPFRWTFEHAPDGTWRQLSWFDWETATADLLMKQASAISGFMDIRCNQPNPGPNQRYFSEALGLDDKSKGLPADEFGAMISSTPDVLAKVEAALHIQQQRVFTPDLLEVEKPQGKAKSKAIVVTSSKKKGAKAAAAKPGRGKKPKVTESKPEATSRGTQDSPPETTSQEAPEELSPVPEQEGQEPAETPEEPEEVGEKPAPTFVDGGLT